MDKLLFLCLCALTVSAVKIGRKVRIGKSTFTPPGEFGFEGCPYNNDFYYRGDIHSPLYPNNYPLNTKCYYYLQAEPGKVLSLNFDDWDVDTTSDIVTIHDGQALNSPILVEIGGPNATTSAPSGTYYTTTRYAAITFESTGTNRRRGFHMNYDSAYTATPCNRDIILIINGMAGMGSQDNFVKQLSFIANTLTPSWQVAQDKIRVVINFQVDDEYAVVWTAADLATNQDIHDVVMGLTDYVPNVLENNNTSVNCLFRYAETYLGSYAIKEDDERSGVAKVIIAFVPQNPNDDQDYYEAQEFAHAIKTDYDAKSIVVTMGSGLDLNKLGSLSYGSGFTFNSDYISLNDLKDPINKAICASLPGSCGA